MRLLATASEGNAELLAAELERLDFAVKKTRRDAVEFNGRGEGLARALVQLRIAERVLVHLHSFSCTDRETLYAGASEVQWEHWLRPDVTIAIATIGKLPQGRKGTKGVLRTHVFASQVIKDALADRMTAHLGARPDVQPKGPDVRIVARIFGDRCNLFFDASGAPLNWRGYRHKSVPAPLSETAAAALLADCGYDGKRTFIDPMCGSGTIAIEAAMIAAGVAPGAERIFGIERWPVQPRKFAVALEHEREKSREARRRAARKPKEVVIALDSDERAIKAARANAEMAGVQGWIRFEQADIADFAPPAPGTLIATNPPYGARIGTELEELYATMGKVLGTATGCDVAVLEGHKAFLQHFGHEPVRTSRLMNGPIPVHLHHFAIKDG